MHLAVPLVIASALFAIGVYAVLARRNAVLVLMGVELMLNAVNLLLVAFDVYLRDTLHTGQALTLFVITIAAAEIGLGLAIVLAVFRGSATIDLDLLRTLADHDDGPDHDGPDLDAPDADQDHDTTIGRQARRSGSPP
ncbi:MAG: NADH-quinone oxidoreductase subunit NuoK [Actinomycetes bacterium]